MEFPQNDAAAAARRPKQIMEMEFPQNDAAAAARCFTKENYSKHVKNSEKMIRYQPHRAAIGNTADCYLRVISRHINICHLENLEVNIADCRGQSYDNGSNMKRKQQGVKRRVLEINKKALSRPCDSHNRLAVILDPANHQCYP
ncbi:UNVERIFIED_CONTAM: hypothetical protein FKN15_007386 [Acipenser sinensis]